MRVRCHQRAAHRSAGNALIECVVLLWAFVPLLYAVQYLGALADAVSVCRQASRYVGFVLAQAPDRTQLNADTLEKQLRQRFFSEESAFTSDVSESDAPMRPLWVNAHPWRVADPEKPMRLTWGSADTGVLSSAWSDEDSASASHAFARRLGLPAVGMVSASVQWALPLPDFLTATLPQGSPSELTLRKHFALPYGHWAGASPSDVQTAVGKASAVAGIDTFIEAYSEWVPFMEAGHVQRPHINDTQSWRDLVPAERLSSQRARP